MVLTEAKSKGLWVEKRKLVAELRGSTEPGSCSLVWLWGGW